MRYVRKSQRSQENRGWWITINMKCKRCGVEIISLFHNCDPFNTLNKVQARFNMYTDVNSSVNTILDLTIEEIQYMKSYFIKHGLRWKK